MCAKGGAGATFLCYSKQMVPACRKCRRCGCEPHWWGGIMGKGRGRALALAAVLFVGMMAGLVGCGGGEGDSAHSGNALRVGVRADIVGFGYLNEQTGNYYGVEIDIAKEMALRMGYDNVEFVTVLPETRKEMLMNGEVDCLVACYSISDTRLENFDFSPAYYDDTASAMVMDSSLIKTIDDLKGGTFGVMAGSSTAPQLTLRLTDMGFTNGEALAQTEDGSDTQFDNFRLVQFPSYEELSIALEEGIVDVACMDGSIMQTYLSNDRSVLDFQIVKQQYGVATQKGSELSASVAETIQGMLDDGTIATMTDKWD